LVIREVISMRLASRLLVATILSGGLAVLAGGNTAAPDDSSSPAEVKLDRLTWKQFQQRLVNKKARYTIVDAWSTTCGPCKENFPHLVAMHQKYAKQGLAVISLSLDDPSDKSAVAEAEKFLKDKKAAFTNVLLDENFGEGFEKLNIGAIPAVFVYGPDGKEVKRFTMDDPNNQFTYEEVEKAINDLLGSKV
jgi:thiol-disulfide isomerase/thioredoxin